MAVVRLRSADGDCFEMSHAAAVLSPLIAGLIEDDPEEIPTPSLKTDALQRVVHHCEWFVQKKCWDHRLLGANAEGLEPLYWASNYLGLEELQSLCLMKLAMVLGREATPTASDRILRHVLEHSVCLPPETIAKVIGLLGRSGKGDLDVLAAIASYSEHAAEAVRLAVVAALAQLAKQGDESVRSRLLTMCKLDKSEKVRSASLTALVKASLYGDPDVLRLATSKIRDADPAMKCSALQVLGGVGIRGDRLAVAAVTCCLEDTNSEVRCAALRALRQLAEKSDSQVLESVVKRFEDGEKTVRQEAVLAMAQVAEDGDAFALSLVCQRLEHRFWWVTKVALDALVIIAQKGSRHAIDAVSLRLRSESANTRRVATDAMLRFLQPGDTYAIEQIAACLEDPMEAVRHNAMHLLAKIGSGSDAAISAICSRLESTYDDVRKAASETIPQVACRGDNHCIHQVALRCDAEQPWVRPLALETLSKCCHRNEAHPLVISLLSRRLVDDDEHVRRTAQKVFVDLFDRGQLQALEPVVKLIEHPDRTIRQRILCCFRTIALGDVCAVDLICKRLGHIDATVRIAALEALRSVAAGLEPRRSRTSAAFSAALRASTRVLSQDLDKDVRSTALRTVAVLVRDASELEKREVAEALLTASHSGVLRRRCLELLERVAPKSLRGRTVLAAAKHLEDPTAQLRRAAAAVLARSSCSEPELVLEELSARVAHRRWRVRWAAVRAMAWAVAAGVDPEAHLAKHLAHSRTRVRDVASFALACFRSGGDLESTLSAVAEVELAADAEEQSAEAEDCEFHAKRRRMH